MGYKNIIKTTADIDSITNSKALINAIEMNAIVVGSILFITRLLEDSSLIVTEPFVVSKIEDITYREETVTYKTNPTLTLYSEEENFEVRTNTQDLFKDVLAVSLDEQTANAIHGHLQDNHRHDIGFYVEKYHEDNCPEELDMDFIMETEFEQRLLRHDL